MKTTITLSPEEVQNLIKSALEQKFKSVGEVTLEVTQELRGYYKSEHYATVFKGATCEVEI